LKMPPLAIRMSVPQAALSLHANLGSLLTDFKNALPAFHTPEPHHP